MQRASSKYIAKEYESDYISGYNQTPEAQRLWGLAAKCIKLKLNKNILSIVNKHYKRGLLKYKLMR